MIYPIVAYGNPILKTKAKDIPKGEDIKELVNDMFETMYNANGVGLAAPQIGKSIRLFVIDTDPIDEGDEEVEKVKKAFINAEIIEETGEEWVFEEGCLSIPNIREDVERQEHIKIKYFDEEWNEHVEEFDGFTARVIQHEYDHIDGILFTDHVSVLKKRMLKGKLANISKGKIKADYKMVFPLKK
jgi:peptide deformylase